MRCLMFVMLLILGDTAQAMYVSHAEVQSGDMVRLHMLSDRDLQTAGSCDVEDGTQGVVLDAHRVLLNGTGEGVIVQFFVEHGTCEALFVGDELTAYFDPQARLEFF